MRLEDFYSGSAIGGAGSGAAMGSTFGPYGAAIGGVAGGLMGALSNSQRSDATEGQRQNLDQMVKALSDKSKQRYQQHMADMDKVMSFYGPAQSYWDRLYAQPGAAPSVGQGSWSNTGVR